MFNLYLNSCDDICLLVSNSINISNLLFKDEFLIEKLLGFISEKYQFAVDDRNTLCLIFFTHNVGNTTV